MATEGKHIEQRIVSRIIDGDQMAFAELYDIYSEKLYYFSLKFLRSKEDAENITQEVFVKVWETRDRLDPDYSISAYLFTIARNTIFNLHRKKVNEKAYLEHLGHHIDFTHSKLEHDIVLKDLQSHVDKIIDDLPAQRKRVFELSRKDGLSHKEISQQLNISEKTIETHIRLALKDIRKFMVEDLNLSILFVLLTQFFN